MPHRIRCVTMRPVFRASERAQGVITAKNNYMKCLFSSLRRIQRDSPTMVDGRRCVRLLPRRMRPLCTCARAKGATFPRLNPPSMSIHSLRCSQSSVSKPHRPRVAHGDPMCCFCRRLIREPTGLSQHGHSSNQSIPLEHNGAHNRPCARAPA
jgi:hypothetical protein